MRAPLTNAERVVAQMLAYYRLAEGYVLSPDEVATWLRQLPAAEYEAQRALSAKQRHLLPNFRRFILEARGLSMKQYMAARLTKPQFQHWLRQP